MLISERVRGLCTAYGHSYGIDVDILRFANIVGSGLEGAVIPDFIEKLENNPDKLEILGNGLQEKSYMYIDDCIEAMMEVVNNSDDKVGFYRFRNDLRVLTAKLPILD
ncbi:MAG: NAD-dependent epimerase/dehydratase family protein, partial [Halobacteria archaeon]